MGICCARTELYRDCFKNVNNLKYETYYLLYKDEKTRFIFNPKARLKKSFEEIQYALTKYKVALQKQKQTEICLSLCNTFVGIFDGNFRKLFDQLDNDIDKIRNFI